MNFDWNNYHRGHNRVVCSAGGSMFVSCMDCGVTANMEAISAKISPADAMKIDADRKQRTSMGQLSPDITYEGAQL